MNIKPLKWFKEVVYIKWGKNEINVTYFYYYY